MLNADLQRFDTEKKVHCLEQTDTCIFYLFAKAYQSEDFNEGQNVFYRINAVGDGIHNDYTYSVSPNKISRFSGTAVLIHGYGGSKEAMLIPSIYSKALGMNVVMLDLFGHGESENEFIFGAEEHKVFTDLLAELNKQYEFAGPVITVGHSMGTLAASKIAQSSELVDGTILLAPMMKFDFAAQSYLKYKSTILNALFSQSIP